MRLTGVTNFRAVYLAPPPTYPETALFVVGNTTLTTSDQAIEDRLTGLGITVTTVNDVASTDFTKDIVVISSTITSSNVNTRYTSFTGGIVQWENLLVDDFEFGGPGAGVYIGSNIDIVDTSHPITTGLSTGNNAIVSTDSTIFRFNTSYGTLLAQEPSSSNHVLVVADEGETSSGGTFAGRRVMFCAGDTVAENFNTLGWTLFDRSIAWVYA